MRYLLLGVFISSVLLIAKASPQVQPQTTPVAQEPSPGAPGAEDTLLESLSHSMREALGHGSTWLALLVAFLGGLLTSLMGCVYPLIPVVMAVIGTRDSKSRFGALWLSALYVLGMCVLYTSLGLIFAGAGKAFGSWLGSPWVAGGIAVFFGLMGLSLAGVFEFRLPASWQNRLNRVGGRGPAGAFLAGLVSGLVMAPCTGPVLSVVLVYIATTRSFLQGFFLLFALSLGTGFLFLLIGTFSGLVRRLPRSGPWMEVVRGIFAAVLAGMGIFFLRGAWAGLDAFTRAMPVPVLIAFWLLVLAAALGGFHLPFDGSVRQKARKLAGLSLGALGVYLLAFAFVVGATGGVKWQKDLEGGLRAARIQKKPAVLDFWATWCPACLDLDSKTFSHPWVAKEMKRFVAVKIDCTESAGDEELEKMMERYGALDLPTIRFVSSRGELLEQPVVKGFVGPEQMLKLLQKIR